MNIFVVTRLTVCVFFFFLLWKLDESLTEGYRVLEQVMCRITALLSDGVPVKLSDFR